MSLPPDDNDFTVLLPPSEDTHALAPGTRLDEFELTAILGQGGFGIVYLAYDHLLEREVALKEYMPSFARRRSGTQIGIQVAVQSTQDADSFEAGRRSFVNEARLLAKFDHPSLVKVYRFWEGNGTAYMVMPYYRGRTLKQVLLARPERPGEDWLKALLAPLLDALETIHRDQCFHRDIAPDNILMLEDGRPVLLDFGAARRAVGAANQAFTVILKQNYAPIEQYAEMPGMGQGAWTDLYALASVVHYAIEGAPPPPAMSRMMADPYVPLATRRAGAFSPGFLQALDRALAFKPGDRPQSVAAMRTLLGIDGAAQTAAQAAPHVAPHAAARAPAATAEALPASPAPVPVPAPVTGRARRRMAVLAGLGVAGVAAALLFAFVGPGHDAGDPAQHGAAGTVAATAATAAAAAAPATATAPAPAPAPATGAMPAPDAPFDPVAALDAVQAGADPQRQVTVRLDKPRLKINEDELHFSVSATHDGYVYVLMVGSMRTDFNLLFPTPKDRDNHLRAGQTLQVPRLGRVIGANGPVGTDHFVVIVSDAPRDFHAAGLVQEKSLGVFPVERAAQLQRDYRGAAPLFAGLPVCQGTPCPAAYGAASFIVDEVAP